MGTISGSKFKSINFDTKKVTDSKGNVSSFQNTSKGVIITPTKSSSSGGTKISVVSDAPEDLNKSFAGIAIQTPQQYAQSNSGQALQQTQTENIIKEILKSPNSNQYTNQKLQSMGYNQQQIAKIGEIQGQVQLTQTAKGREKIVLSGLVDIIHDPLSMSSRKTSEIEKQQYINTGSISLGSNSINTGMSLLGYANRPEADKLKMSFEPNKKEFIKDFVNKPKPVKQSKGKTEWTKIKEAYKAGENANPIGFLKPVTGVIAGKWRIASDASSKGKEIIDEIVGRQNWKTSNEKVSEKNQNEFETKLSNIQKDTENKISELNKLQKEIDATGSLDDKYNERVNSYNKKVGEVNANVNEYKGLSTSFLLKKQSKSNTINEYNEMQDLINKVNEKPENQGKIEIEHTKNNNFFGKWQQNLEKVPVIGTPARWGAQIADNPQNPSKWVDGKVFNKNLAYYGTMAPLAVAPMEMSRNLYDFASQPINWHPTGMAVAFAGSNIETKGESGIELMKTIANKPVQTAGEFYAINKGYEGVYGYKPKPSAVITQFNKYRGAYKPELNQVPFIAIEPRDVTSWRLAPKTEISFASGQTGGKYKPIFTEGAETKINHPDGTKGTEGFFASPEGYVFEKTKTPTFRVGDIFYDASRNPTYWRENIKNIGFNIFKADKTLDIKKITEELGDKPRKIAIDWDETLVGRLPNGKMVLRPETVAFLEALTEKGHKLNVFSHGFRDRVKSEVKQFGLEKYFEQVLGREDYGNKNTPENKRKPIEQIGADVLIDNRLINIAKTKLAGMKGIKVKSYYPKRNIMHPKTWTMSKPHTIIGKSEYNPYNNAEISKYYAELAKKGGIQLSVAPKTLHGWTQPEREIMAITNKENLKDFYKVKRGYDKYNNPIYEYVSKDTPYLQRAKKYFENKIQNYRNTINEKDMITSDIAERAFLKRHALDTKMEGAELFDNSGYAHETGIVKIGHKLGVKNINLLEAFAKAHDSVKEPVIGINNEKALARAVKENKLDFIPEVAKLSKSEKAQLAKMIERDTLPPFNAYNLIHRFDETTNFKTLTPDEKLIIMADRLDRFGSLADPNMLWKMNRKYVDLNKFNPVKNEMGGAGHKIKEGDVWTSNKTKFRQQNKNTKYEPEINSLKENSKNQYSNEYNKYKTEKYDSNYKYGKSSGYKNYKNSYNKYEKSNYANAQYTKYNYPKQTNYNYKYPKIDGKYPTQPYPQNMYTYFYGGNTPYPTKAGYKDLNQMYTLSPPNYQKQFTAVAKIDRKENPKSKKEEKLPRDLNLKRFEDPFMRWTGKKYHSDILTKLLRERYGNLHS